MRWAEEVSIVEALTIRPGDSILVVTDESLSSEALYKMRGLLADHFAERNIDVTIICAKQILKIEGEHNARDDG